MDNSTLINTIQTACPTVNPLLIQDLVGRMDPDYFEQFSMTDIQKHLGLMAQLAPGQPVAMDIQKMSGFYKLTVVAYDYFSEFATICGVLSSFGLNVQEAFIYTYGDQAPKPASSLSSRSFPSTTSRRRLSAKSSHPPGLSRKKVVDVFHVRVLKGFAFGPTEQHQLKERLTAMIRLLDANQVREARSQINRYLMETLGRLKTHFSKFLHPVHIRFQNDPSARETIMEIRSTDSPAFLYTFANALTMRGVYIAKANIEVDGGLVRNRFFIRGRHGNKIEQRAEQQELKSAAALIKEFTHFLMRAPDPGKALEHFDQFLDHLLDAQHQSSEISLLAQKPLLAHLAQLFGTSDFLWEDFLRRQHAHLLPLMDDPKAMTNIRPPAELAKALKKAMGRSRDPLVRKERLNQFKDQELFRIDMKHLLDNMPIPDFSLALTHLAEVILNQVLEEAKSVVDRIHPPPVDSGGKPFPFAICGLGKLGGRELGYASDIEVLFVYDAPQKKRRVDPSEYFERLAQEILRWIEAKQEGIFHIDTRLRPHGEKGTLANSLDEIRSYYAPQGQAAPFERQALIKLRAVAGDPALGRQIEKHRDQFVYSPEPWPLDVALHIRDRQIKELVPAGQTHVKYSPGGLIDVEYTIQYLQLIHGHAHPSLHTPNTLQALQALGELGLLSKEELATLPGDYLFLRQLVDGLRIVRGNTKDLLLPEPESDAMIFLARRLGFMTEDWKAGARQLWKEITSRMSRVRKMFLAHFGHAMADRIT